MAPTKLTAHTLNSKTILQLIAKTLVAFVKKVSLLEEAKQVMHDQIMSTLS